MLNPIIETFIGLIFVYLLFSMVCSTVQEFLAALFAWRAKTLRDGVRNMVSGDEDLVQRIYQHPLIRGLARQSWWDRLWHREGSPSYISKDVFAKAFVAAAGVNVNPSDKTPSLTDVPPKLKELLGTFAQYAPGDINTLRANIESWYEDAMDRVSGWYKRKTQVSILLIGVTLAVLANADTIMLARAFWTDPTLRAAAVTAATDWVKTHQAQGTEKRDQDVADLYPSTTEPGTAPIPPREETLSKATENLTTTLAQVQNQLNTINVPLGWWCDRCEVESNTSQQSGQNPCKEQKQAQNKVATCTPNQIPRGGQDWVVKIFGLLLTTLALSQGAPFWFGLLQKLVNIRLAGAAPDEKKK